MRSHDYHFTARDLARSSWRTLAVLLALAVILHGMSWLGWPPGPGRSARGGDTALRHQASACFREHPAEIVLVGDSTCHIAVDAAALSGLLPGRPRVINLALIIPIGLGWYARAAADFAATNPDQVRWVILLVSPAKLAMEGTDEPWMQMREDARREAFYGRSAPSPHDRLGTGVLRDRFAGWLLPEVLGGIGASRYGFATGLDQYMAAHDGSLVDFGEYMPRRGRAPASWPTESEFRAEFEEFRRQLPPQARLAFGLTPIPAAIAPANAQGLQLECLRAWSRWLPADRVLMDLPSTLPTPWFSASGHMNEFGQRMYTAILAKELSRRL